MHPIGLIFGLFAIGTVLLDAFETIILPRRASGKIRLTRVFYRLTWRPWAAVVTRFSNRRLRETGFENIRDCQRLPSTIPALRGLETREESTLVFEAGK